MDNKDGQEKKPLPVYKTMEEFMRAHDVAEKDPLPPPPPATDMPVLVCRIIILTILLEILLLSVYFVCAG